MFLTRNVVFYHAPVLGQALQLSTVKSVNAVAESSMSWVRTTNLPPPPPPPPLLPIHCLPHPYYWAQ